jgi:hypothetical protein
MTSRSGSENRRRNIAVHVRVDAAEKALIEEAAKRQGLSVPELLRRNALRNVEGDQSPVSRRQPGRSAASSRRPNNASAESH